MNRSNIRELLNQGERHLVENGVPNARKNVEWMLGHVLDCRSTDLYLAGTGELPGGKIRDYEELVRRRGAREPLQYILGSTEFMGLPFLAAPGVFIPRPDTEILVEAVETRMNMLGEPRTILDLCCGSGVIAVSLAKRVNAASAIAVDISSKAVELTARNATLNGVESKVRAVCAEAVEYLTRSDQQFDAVVCNPPYVPRADIPDLSPEIRIHEPLTGLDGGDDGQDFYRASIPLLRRVLRPGGLVAFEIGSHQRRGVSELMRAAAFPHIDTHQDFGGADRVIVACEESSSGSTMD